MTGLPGVSFVTLYSPALRRRADITLFIPPGNENRPLPLLILMHGVYGSHWNWTVLGNVPATAMEMIREGSIGPFAIAMPSDGLWGDGSGYVVHRELDAESWIVDDVPGGVRAVCPELQADRIFLAGQSMGGFGALRLGAKYAARIGGISAHSPVTRLADLMQHVQQPLKEYLAAGKRDTDILTGCGGIERNCHRSASTVALRMRCSTAIAPSTKRWSKIGSLTHTRSIRAATTGCIGSSMCAPHCDLSHAWRMVRLRLVIRAA